MINIIFSLIQFCLFLPHCIWKLMKSYLSKIAVLFLAILVLLSSSFVVIDTHLCCGNIVDSSIFGKADMCKMDMVSCKLENNSTSKLKGSCCYNIKEYKSSELFKKNNPIIVDTQQFNFIPTLYLQTTTNLFIESEINKLYYKNYKPPLITRDLLVLVQCFLI
jgi:hypothetical protein